MNNERFTEILKSKLDEPKENTVFSLTTGDSNYRKLSSELGQAEARYMTLSLPIEQKTFIDYYISLIDNCNMEYSTINYLAGLIDGQKFGNLIPTNCNTETATSESILKYYYQLHQPCAECYETASTLAFWKELHNERNIFASSLSPEQAARLEELSTQNLEGIGYSTADSFVHGFQACAKLFHLIIKLKSTCIASHLRYTGTL